MKRNLVIVYWLMLLVSTCAIGGVAFYLLRRENQHLRELAQDAVERKGRTISASLDLLVSDAKEGLTQGLAEFSDPGLEPQLVSWKESNPYVRSVFVFRPGPPGRGNFTLPLQNSREGRNLIPWLRSGNGWIWSTQAVVASQVMQFQKVQVLPRPADDAFNASAAGTLGQTAALQNALNNGQVRNPRADMREAAKLGTSTTNTLAGSIAGNAPPQVRVTGALAGNGAMASVNSFRIETNGLTTVTTNQADIMTVSDVSASLQDGVLTISQGNLIFTNNGQMLIQTPVTGNGPMVRMTVSETIASSKPEQGWVYIGAPEDSRWLGWMRPSPGAPVRGVELDWSGLIEPMRANVFPSRVDAGEGFVLRNSAGKSIVSRFGNDELAAAVIRAEEDKDDAPQIRPITVLSVGPDLPGWTLAVYHRPTTSFSSSFMLVSTVMVATLLVSVVVGGTLLLREARREASDAARKTSFVSNVSHELKTPLTTIRMYAELLGDGRARAPEKQNAYLATIIGESQRLTRLVNNVLDFSRMDQGRKKYNPDNVPLGSVIENVLAAQRPRLQEAGLECEAELPIEDDVRVRVDRDALEQVLLNLLDNAMKYAAQGHWVGVRVTKDANNAVLTVSDQGPGVPSAHRDKIFDVFHRVDDSITARQPGSGLGLSIARRLLRDQGGDLRFEPNSPIGSTFVATIPLAAPIAQLEAAGKEA